MYMLLSVVFSFRSCFRLFFFFKQKTAYEMRISDWSSDVCSSDLLALDAVDRGGGQAEGRLRIAPGDIAEQFEAGRPGAGGGGVVRRQIGQLERLGLGDRKSVV